jgi:hypothetical protein
MVDAVVVVELNFLIGAVSVQKICGLVVEDPSFLRFGALLC